MHTLYGLTLMALTGVILFQVYSPHSRLNCKRTQRREQQRAFMDTFNQSSHILHSLRPLK